RIHERGPFVDELPVRHADDADLGHAVPRRRAAGGLQVDERDGRGQHQRRAARAPARHGAEAKRSVRNLTIASMRGERWRPCGYTAWSGSGSLWWTSARSGTRRPSRRASATITSESRITP